VQRRFPIIRRVVLLLGDTILILTGLILAILVNGAAKTAPQHGILAYYQLFPVVVVASWLVLTANSLLSIVRMLASQVIISVGVAIFQLLIITMAASFFLFESHSRAVFLLAAVFQFVLLSLWKYINWRIEKARLKPKNVLVIGSGQDCNRIIARLSSQNFSHFLVRCCLISQTETNDLWQREMKQVDLIIIASDVPLAKKALIVEQAHNNGKQVAFIPDFYELFCLNTELDKYDDIPVFRAKYLRPTMETRLMKRGLDLVVAVVGLLVLWPVFIAVAAAIRLEGRGPVFYTQVRTGRDEKEFVIYKFRTMRTDAEKLSGPVLAASNDPRITRVGNFLRATRLDELPQLLNVIRGEMSIVGPRPERPVFVEQLKQTIPNYHYRHNVKPGITGFAQVHGKYNTLPQDKLVYDLIYIQRCSVLTDLELMLQTVRVLLIKDSTEGVTVQRAQVQAARAELAVDRKSSGA
jgi:exopolysaccharide biosynthesis polyprenyl glycosylphosphotransferase